MKRAIHIIAPALLSWSLSVANAQNFAIDFAVEAPNQLIAAPAGISISEVAVSAGTLSYGAFSTAFENAPHAHASGGWMATVEPLEAKNFFFTITADPGYSFSLTAVSSLVRSTGAGPSGVALIIGDTIVETISAPDSGTPVLSISGAAVAAQTHLTSVTIRIAGFDDGSRPSTGGGALRISGIGGELAVIPEPAFYTAFLGMVAVFVVLVRQGRRRPSGLGRQ